MKYTFMIMSFLFGIGVSLVQAGSIFGNLSDKGITIEGGYTVDYWSNQKGGIKKDDTFLTNFDLTLELDTEKVGLWNNGRLFVYFLENSGGEKLTESIVGDLQTVSNIEAPRRTRVYEFWYEHWLDEDFSVLFGIHDYNSEFNVTEYGGLFINSSFGIQPDISAGARPSIFPLASLGSRIKFQMNESSEFLFGVYDGDPGDPEEDERFPRSDFDSESGVFLAGEWKREFLDQKLPGFFKLGGWYNTGEFTDFSGNTEDGNAGVYLVMDKALYQEQESEQGLGVFVQLGINDQDLNDVHWYAGTGVYYLGLFPGRDQDEAGFAIAHAQLSDDLSGMTGRDDSETVFELTYNAVINDHVRIQPDLQYILNPGADSTLKDAFVVGLRTEISF